MTIEQLQKDMIAAMKSGDKMKKSVISSLIAAIKKVAIDKKCKDNITEELVNEVLIKEQKSMQESIDTCPSNRPELLEEYTQHLEIIKTYAPQLIADPEMIKSLVYAYIDPSKITKKNRGQIMKEFKGRVDMKVLNQVISNLLS